MRARIALPIFVLGVLSGALSGFLVNSEYLPRILPGALFAGVLVLDGRLREPKLSFARSLLLIATSVIAYYCAVEVGMEIGDERSLGPPVAGFLGGGMLGLGVGLAHRSNLLVNGVVLGLVGAVLAVPFFHLPHPSLAFMLWQGGVALAVQGTLMRRSP